ncbi:MAG TPA: VWA domain-containing protein [Blastocatellia bacterium]|nr:VWA domain-containing protein [Blastocatellia bacterium]
MHRRSGHRTLARIAALTLCLASIVGAAAAQSGRRPPPRPQTDTQGNPDADVQLGTQEVLLSVSVRDSNGRPVIGLSGDDFIIAEDRVRQQLTSFRESEVPVHVVLLLDASGSVFSELGSIRKAAESFVSALGPEDEVSVIQFAQKVELLQDWTTDREAIQHALDWRYKGGEATCFWDGVFLAADEQVRKVEGRRAIIILSDGVDTSSKVSQAQAVAALDKSGATVFVVSKAQALIERIKPYAGKAGTLTGSSRPAREAIESRSAAQETVRALADRYGGRLFAPITDADLATAYGDVAKELKQQYVVTYVSTNDTRDKHWRSIEIYSTRPGLTVRTRKGYVVE